MMVVLQFHCHFDAHVGEGKHGVHLFHCLEQKSYLLSNWIFKQLNVDYLF